MEKVAVLGAGSWGTALAVLLARNGLSVRLWGHRPKHIATLIANRTNARYLPNVLFPDALQPVFHLEEALSECSLLLLAVPSHSFEYVLANIAPFLTALPRIVFATKGLDLKTGRMLHEVIQTVVGPAALTAVLSGPSFAGEVVAGLPTAVTIASYNHPFAVFLARLFGNERFRVYTSRDVIGVQLGGAVKNVLAIAAGVSDGLGFGANCRAALITRGLAEMMRLGAVLGAQPETLMGLSGIGDVILTCTDDQSRNRRLGLGLGQGYSLESVISSIGQEIEGILTAKVVFMLAQKNHVDMPIVEQTYRLLYEGLSPARAVHNLLAREQKPEW